ncbi:MAG: PAS domain S-box protein [Gemmatimonadaceae bacterium]|nr:PAS domain S-box protein [Gemmatimonadaceae bacterium]
MTDQPRAGDHEQFYDLPFIGMAVTSPSSKLWLQVNETLCEILGYPREELIAKTWAELTHPDDLSADLTEFDRVMRGESEGYKLEKRFVRKDGAVIPAAIDVKCERAPDGRIERFYVTVADISQRSATESALRASSDLLANLARQVPGVIYQFRLYPDGRSCFPFASDAIWDIYEVTPQEVHDDAAAVFGRLHPDDLDAVSASIARSSETLEPWSAEYRVVLPRQGVRWRSGLARPERLADGSTLWHGFITDITAQRNAQAALAESEQRYRVQIESAPEAIVVYDMDSGRFADANDNATKLFECDRTTLLQLSVSDVSPVRQPDGRLSVELAMPLIGRALAGESPVFEWTHRTVAGRDFPTEVRLVRLPSASHRLVRGSITDISERKRAEEDLRIKDKAIATSLNAIVIADAEGRVRYANPAFLQMWGYASESEIVGLHATEFAEPQASAAALESVAATGSWQGELVARRQDGTSFDIVLSVSVVHDTDGRVMNFMGSIADVTESKRLQAQLHQSQKMQSVGRLAGGVAHDFNNLLTVMKGYLDLARTEVPTPSALAEDLAEVDRAVDSAASLTQQLLAFSRKQVISPRVLSLNESVTRMHGMLSRLLGEDIELFLSTSTDLGLVRFDPNQIEQLLINLAVNARDAMPNGGRLSLETANVLLDARSTRIHPDSPPGEYVMLTVSDTGTGMSAEVQSHLFEPFYTTKEPGRGTGLGLAMVYGAITQNGGHIEVDSQLGRGTRFRICLPRVQDSAAPDISPTTTRIPRGSETVVVVEDEDSIRALAVRVLVAQGYRVEAFRSGILALRAVAERTVSPDLVLTDVIMPDMHGRDLANRLRELRPRLRILFASGYPEDVIAHHGVLDDDVDFLPKPYSMATLAQRVRDALDRPLPT